MSKAVKEYAANQNRVIQELLWIERILRRQGVPIEKARDRQGRGRFTMSLHQTYEKLKTELELLEQTFGNGDVLVWETGFVEQQYEPWIDNSVHLLEDRLHKKRGDCFNIQVVTFTLGAGWRPNIEFFVRAYLVDGRAYWELSMRRHAQLHGRLTREERRINKPFRLKSGECRWITRSKAEEAIAHFVSIFLPGYCPFNG